MKRIQRFADTVVSAICEHLATPVSLGVYLRIKHGCYDELANAGISPSDYLSKEAYLQDVIVVDMLRKDASLPTTVDRKRAAVKKFWEGERDCYWTNERLVPYLEGASHPSWNSGVDSAIRRVRGKIRDILGACPSSDRLDPRFGPGSTFGDRGRLTTVADKMQSSPTITPGAHTFLQTWSITAWGRACARARRHETTVRGNRFLTVPKNAKTDRSIAVEPSVNVFYQLALGSAIRRRLNKVGIDLDFGQAVHRQVACEASYEGHYATIDLSNASDTVCYNLVKLLLPGPWFELLTELRSPFTLVDGKWTRLEKFSSMGNGYTFELETLIFYAISLVATEGDCPELRAGVRVFTYGDDIIVPTESSRATIALLRFLGFETNVDKTFVDGPFRESCGGDFFGGEDVRPHYIREDILEPQHYIALANGLWRLREKASSQVLRDALLKARFRVLDQLPAQIKALRGPSELGDLVITDAERFWKPSVRNSQRFFRAYSPIEGPGVSWAHFSDDVTLASALYLAGSRQSVRGDIYASGLAQRGNVSGYRIKKVVFS